MKKVLNSPENIKAFLRDCGFIHMTGGNGCHEYIAPIEGDDIYVYQINGIGLSEIKSVDQPVIFSVNGKDPSVTPLAKSITEYPNLQMLIDDESIGLNFKKVLDDIKQKYYAKKLGGAILNMHSLKVNDIDKRFADTFGFIEADGYGRMHLYFDWRKHGLKVEQLSGVGFEIGTFGGLPVFLSVLWYMVNNKLVGVWECTSKVMHSDLVKTWFEIALPHVKANNDSMNDHNTLLDLDIKPDKEFIYDESLKFLKNEHMYEMDNLASSLKGTKHEKIFSTHANNIRKLREQMAELDIKFSLGLIGEVQHSSELHDLSDNIDSNMELLMRKKSTA